MALQSKDPDPGIRVSNVLFSAGSSDSTEYTASAWDFNAKTSAIDRLRSTLTLAPAQDPQLKRLWSFGLLPSTKGLVARLAFGEVTA